MLDKTKYRIGSIAARDVTDGDTLIKMGQDIGGIRPDLATVIGTVLTVRKTGDGVPSWLVRTPEGSVIERLAEGGPMVLTYVHVPWGRL